MSSISAGTTSTTTLVHSGDTTGSLVFKTNDTGSGGTTAMTIDTSQNVGVQITPVTTSLGPSIQLGNQMTLTSFNGNSCYFDNNIYYNGSFKYTGNGYGASLRFVDGNFVFSNAPSNSSGAGASATLTERMRIDSSGNVGIGTSSPTTATDIVRSNTSGNDNQMPNLFVRNTSATQGNGSSTFNQAGVSVSAGNSTVTGGIRAAYDSAGSYGTGVQFYVNSTNPLQFYSNGSERMRITSGGYLLVGTTVANYLGHNSSNSMNSDGSTHALSLTISASGFAEAGGGAFPIGVLRSASSSYVFAGFYSGNDSTSAFADKEFSFRGDGNGYCDGTWNNNGADYAEYFESANGQALSVGTSVVLDGNKVRESTEQDDQSAIIGVVRPKEPSKASMVIGNTAWNKWANKYLTDDFDRYIMEDHDVVEWTDEDGKSHSYESQNVPSDVIVPANAIRKTHDENGVKFQHYKINPEWNPDAEYVNRENRPEWNIIGLVGQVKLLKDQPVNARWIKMRDVSASVEEWFIR